MSLVTGILIVLGILVGIPIAIFIFVIAWRSGKSYSASTVAGAVGVVVIVGVVWYILANSEDVAMTAAVITLLAIALYGAWKSGGGGSKWVTYLVVFSLIAFLGQRLYYGPEATKVTKKWQDQNFQAAMTPDKDKRMSGVREKVGRQQIIAPPECAKPVRVMAHQCIHAWGATPGGNTFSTKVIFRDGKTMLWMEYRAQSNTLGNPEWYQFCGDNGVDAEVEYEIVPVRECKF